jgi:WXG100 family type VII secretion target
MANINVTYEQMNEAAGRINLGREEITNKLTELNSLVDDLVASGFVTDQSSREFDATFEQFITSTKSGIEALEGLAKFLTSAADAMSQTDEALARAISTN